MAGLNGEAILAILGAVMRGAYPEHRWNDLWRSIAVDHPLRDEWWEERNMLPRLAGVEIPAYLGCDWENVPLHLPSTFAVWKALAGNPSVRVGLLGAHGLTWPWESLHLEALAWFDHWLKDADTGIMDGPPIRYWMPGAEEFREADAWPVPGARHVELALRADGVLGAEEGESGTREYLQLPDSLDRPKGVKDPGLHAADVGDAAAERPARARRRDRAPARREHDRGGHRVDRHAPGRRHVRGNVRRDRRVAARKSPGRRREAERPGRPRAAAHDAQAGPRGEGPQLPDPDRPERAAVRRRPPLAAGARQ